MKKVLSIFVALTIVMTMFVSTGIMSVSSDTTSKITITKEPDVKTYAVGDAFSIKGLKVEVTYSDNTKKTVDNSELKFKSGIEVICKI